MRIDAGKPSPAGAVGGLTFTSPAGTAITDFSLDAPARLREPGRAGKRPSSRSTSSAASCSPARATTTTPPAIGSTRSELVRLPGERGAPRARASRPAPTSPRSPPTSNDCRTLLLRVGCYRRNTACQVGPGGRVFHVVYGAQITVNDFTPPAILVGRGRRACSRAAARRLGPRDGHGERQRRRRARRDRRRHRSRPRRASSARRTTPSAHYEAGEQRPTRARRARSGWPSRAPTSRARRSGRARCRSGAARCSCASSTPAATSLDRGPYTVDVITPSDRGDANGTSAKEPGRIILRFSATKQKRRTVRYGKKAGIRGRLINADGKPDRRRRRCGCSPATCARAPARSTASRLKHPLRRLLPPHGPRARPRGSSSSRGARARTTPASPPTAT